MKNLMAGLLVLAATTANAGGFVPATVTKGNMAPQLIDIRTSVADQIAARTAAGYHYASVDMDGATWKEEKAIMKELQGLGYEVDFGNDHRVYGWNSLNGALVVRWGEKRWGPIFGK